MGAFLLYQKEKSVDVEAAKATFREKGFSDPNSFDLGSWRLLHYKKILLDVDNYIVEGDGSLFCCGTVVYRGLGYRDTLKALLSDFRNNTVDQNELIGHFCLIFWDGARLTALTDPLNTLHIFVNDQCTCFSSSFLALLSASPHPLPLNRLAVCEKLSTGYIVSPDTMVEGISQLNDELAHTFTHDKDKLKFLTHPPRPQLRLHNQGLEESISRQVENLKDHFSKLDNLNSEYFGELGLSDGYDSRIVLACSNIFTKPLSLHTHAAEKMNCHNSSKVIVQQIASKAGYHLSIVPTKHLLLHEPDKVESILEGCIRLFDARCSHNMGAFSETYTREYREKVLINGQRFTLNGLGGEVFRNYYGTNRYCPIDLRQWMNCNVYYPFAKDAVDNDELFEEMHKRRVEKISARLGLPCMSKVDFLWIRRYYSEVRMPDCDSNNADAQNQLSFYHMPFIQPKITYEGINANPYIGIAGGYQMKLIQRLSPEMASFPTHYGYPPDQNIPIKYAMRYRVKELLPPRILNQRKRKIIPVNNKAFIEKTEMLLDKSSLMSKSKEALMDTELTRDFDKSIWDNSQRATTFFIGTFLAKYGNKLTW